MEYWMVMTGGREEAGGINGYCCTIVVDDFDGLMAKALAHGATEAMPKFALVGMAWQGYFIDTEGNTVGLHQPDVSAK